MCVRSVAIAPALPHQHVSFESKRAVAGLFAQDQLIRRQLPVSQIFIMASFDEYLLTLLLHHHPHNYSDDIAEPMPAPVPGVVRRAERYIIDHAQLPITVSQVAIDSALVFALSKRVFVSGDLPRPISS